MPPSGGSSAPQGAFTNNPGANASVYQPTAQPQADTLFQQIVGLNGQGAFPTDPTQTPAGQAYPTQLDNSNLFANNPFYNTNQNEALLAQSVAPQYWQQAMAGTNALNNAAFDPQQQLYNDTLNKVQQQSAASAANSGLMGTPYGQSVSDDALSSFNTQWQNQQLNREIAGSQAANANTAAATQNLLTAAGAPSSVLQNQISGSQQLATGAANLGNNQYLLPQQVLNDLQSYLGLGQSSSQISGQLGQMGVNENLAQQQLQMQQLGQLGQGFGGLSSLATGGKGLTSLFGGGADLAGGGASLAADGVFSAAPAAAAVDSGVSGAFGAADLLPAAALS